MKSELKAAIDRIAMASPVAGAETDRLMEEAFSMAVTAEEKHEAGRYLLEAVSRRKRPDVDVKGALGEAAEFLNLSYIAKRYFNRDRTWLYQRLHHSLVNGKPAAFTESELRMFSDSLKEIGHIINHIQLT